MRFSCIKNNIKYFVLMVILCGLSIELQAMAGARRGLTSVARNYRTLVNRASVPMSRFSSAATGAMHKGATQTRMSAQKFSTMAEGALGNTPFDVKVLEFVNNYHGVAESIYDVTNERPSSSLLQQFWRFSLGFKALSNIKTSNIKTSGIPLASKKAFDGFYHDLIKEKSVTVEQQARLNKLYKLFNDQFQGQISNQDFFKQLNVWYKVGVLKEDPAAYIDLYKSLLALDTQGTTELNKQNIEPALADFASKMFSSAQDALTKTGNKSPDLRNIEKKTKGLMDAL